MDGYRAATRDMHELGDRGRVDLVAIGVFIVLLAVAYLIAHEAGAF